MKRKRCIGLLLLLIFVLAFTFVACSKKDGDTSTVTDNSPTEQIPAHTHTYSTDWSFDTTHHWHAATCEHSAEVSDKAEHIWDDGTITTPASETSAGIKTYTCTVCGATKTERIEPLPHTHVYGDWSLYSVATCSAQGEERRYCACGGYESRKTAIDPDNHNYIDRVTLEPTYLTQGERTYTCSYCNDSYAEPISVLLPSEGLSYALKEDDTYKVIGIGTCTDAKIGVPALYQGKAVTEIGSSAFDGCTSLVSITIPSSVTSIAEMAFSECTALTSVILCEGLEGIDDFAFYNCTALAVITLPQSLICIGDHAFNYCSSLPSIVIPANVELLSGEHTFSGCTSLESVIFESESKITSIGAYAFKNCSALTSIVLPTHLETIFGHAFINCESLTSIDIPSSVTSIGEEILFGCSSLIDMAIPFVGNRAGVTKSDTEQYPFGYFFGTTSYTNSQAAKGYFWISKTDSEDAITYQIPASLRNVTVKGGYMPRGAFYGCSMLTSVTLGADVTNIGVSAFKQCYNLPTVTFAENSQVSIIDSYAFEDNTGLQYITIPSSVTTFGKEAFDGCKKLSSIVFEEGSQLSEIPSDCFKYAAFSTIIIPNSVSRIGTYAFAWSHLQTLNLGASLTVIESEAFKNCTSLTAVYYTGELKDWCDVSLNGATSNPLYYAHNLYIGGNLVKDLVLPATVTSLTGLSFVGGNLSSLAVEEGNSTYQAVGNCIINTGNHKLTLGCNNSVIPNDDSVTGINKYAFSACPELTSVTIPASVISIANGAFIGCDALSSLAVEEGNTAYYSAGNCVIKKDSHALIVGCKTSVIPNDGTITEIANNAFDTISTLTEITIPEGVTSIGTDAFYACTSLKHIHLPDTLTTIGITAFYRCESLESIVLPPSLKEIKTTAFSHCSGLKTVMLYKGLEKIGAYAFAGPNTITDVYFDGTEVDRDAIDIQSYNTALTSATWHYEESLAYNLKEDDTYEVTGIGTYNGAKLIIPATYNGKAVTSIAEYAFKDNIALSSVEIANSIKEIGFCAFQGCLGLTSLAIPVGMTSLDACAFKHCSALTSVTLPSTLTTIRNAVFEGTALKTITLPTGVTEINDYTFKNCKSLTSIIIPNGITSIGAEAFRGCTILTSITISSSVTSVGLEAFKDCTCLSDICFDGTSNQWSMVSKGANWAQNVGKDSASGTYMMFYSNGLTYEYNGESYIVTGIGTFSGAELIIPAKYNCKPVTEVATNAFRENIALIAVTIPEGVTKIGTTAFLDCTGLTTISIPTSVTHIGGWAFKNTSLAAVTIPDSLTTLEDGVFEATNLRSVKIPESVTSIGMYAFKNIKNLQSIVLPANVKILGKEAFRYCSGLQSVTLSSALETIGSMAFQGCTGLTSIMIPKNVTSIGANAFESCTGLKSVYYDGTTTEWCMISFGGTTANPLSYAHNLYINGVLLVDLVIPEGVTSIKSRVFTGCTSLTSISIPKSLTDIGMYAFDACARLTSITVAEGNERYHSAGNCLIETETKTLIRGCKETQIPTDGSVTIIGDSAFWKCTTLTSIIIPETVTVIEKHAFTECAFAVIAIPAKVTSIGTEAFKDCILLSDVYFGGSEEQWSSVSKGSNWVQNAGKNTVKETYTMHYASQGLAYTLSGDTYAVTGIGTFTGTDLVIPSSQDGTSVRAVAASAFQDNTNVTTLMIPYTVTRIGASAFEDCNALTSILLSEGIMSIGSHAFSGCTNLTSIIFQGTKVQWNAISKGTDWDYNSGTYTIHCIDGNIEK